MLASGGRCKGRGAVVGVEKRGGGRGALNENLFEHINIVKSLNHCCVPKFAHNNTLPTREAYYSPIRNYQWCNLSVLDQQLQQAS